MTPARLRSTLRLAVGVCLTALLSAAILFLLLTRLQDASGAWWAGRITLAALVATVADVAAICLLRDEP